MGGADAQEIWNGTTQLLDQFSETRVTPDAVAIGVTNQRERSFFGTARRGRLLPGLSSGNVAGLQICDDLQTGTEPLFRERQVSSWILFFRNKPQMDL